MTTRKYADWLGKEQRREELFTQTHVDGLNALLDHLDGQPLGLHWMLCQPRTPQSALGPDGHAMRGGFLPPVELPRRMWAAGDVSFHGTPRPGQLVERFSRVAEIESKIGRSGELVFVKVDHEYRGDGILWIKERHTIVYREASGSAGAATPESLDTSRFEWRQQVTTDPVQLFRYSALTYNGHRIHYDHPYVTKVEGYPNLVVHGPLMATWLMNFANRNLGRDNLATFNFRVLAPVFCGETITLLGRSAEDGFDLAVVNEKGQRVIAATATSRPPPS